MTLRILAYCQDITSHSHRRTITLEEHETFKSEVTEPLKCCLLWKADEFLMNRWTC